MTYLLQFQADEAERHMAVRAVDVFAVLLAMIHLKATGGAESDRGAGRDPFDLRQADGLARLEKLQHTVDAAIVVAAVRSRSRTFPLLPTLPAEVVSLFLISCADEAVDTQVGEILPLHTCTALGALAWETDPSIH